MDSKIPLGYCHCGCGQKTEISRWTDARYGRVKGEHLRFIVGHHWSRWNDPAMQQMIVEMYQAGESFETLSNKVGISGSKARKILKSNGIQIRPFKKQRKYSLDESAFDEITEHSAYWAGFLMADGAIVSTNTGRCISVTLSSRDIDHLYAFRKFLGSTHPIKSRERITITGKRSMMAQYVVASERLPDRLAEFGVVPRKSLIAEAKLLHDNPHFWRGVIDGDGCVRLFLEKGCKRVSLVLVGSKRIVEQFHDFVRKISPKSKPKPFRRRDSKAWCIAISDSHAVRVTKAIYDDCTIALPRKKSVADEISVLPLPLVSDRRRKQFKNTYGPDGMAWCSGCQKYYPVDRFHRNSSNSHGLASYCRDCVKEKDHIRNARKRNPAA